MNKIARTVYKIANPETNTSYDNLSRFYILFFKIFFIQTLQLIIYFHLFLLATTAAATTTIIAAGCSSTTGGTRATVGIVAVAVVTTIVTCADAALVTAIGYS